MASEMRLKLIETMASEMRLKLIHISNDDYVAAAAAASEAVSAVDGWVFASRQI